MNEVIIALQTLLQSSLGASYKKYFYGENRVPEQVYFPFIEVIPLGTTITNRWTGGMLNSEYNIQINIKTSLKKYLKQNTNNQILDYVQDLVKRVEERNVDGTFKTGTIMQILHDNLNIINTVNIQ